MGGVNDDINEIRIKNMRDTMKDPLEYKDIFMMHLLYKFYSFLSQYACEYSLQEKWTVATHGYSTSVL